MGKLRLLIIDSNTVFSSSARQYLISCPGVECVQVYFDLKQAIEEVSLIQPHYIFIDYNLLRNSCEEEFYHLKFMQVAPAAKIVCLTLFLDIYSKGSYQDYSYVSVISKENFAKDVHRLFEAGLETH